MVIEGIEEVSIQLELNPLGDMEALSKAHIPVIDARLAEEITRRSAKHARGRLREAAEVDPLKLPGQALVNIAARGPVSALEEGS